jgi:ATP:cob(I)alamin adenosyltransferase
MKVTTKTGDQGQTGVFNQRVEKDSLIIDLLGHLDEVMANMIDVYAEFPEANPELKDRVDELILMASIVAGFKEEADFGEERVAHLEEMIKLHNEKCFGFVYPFDNPMKARLNVLRTVVRRCERVMVRAFKENRDLPLIRVYMNRLSDYVFILINR